MADYHHKKFAVKKQDNIYRIQYFYPIWLSLNMHEKIKIIIYKLLIMIL